MAAGGGYSVWQNKKNHQREQEGLRAAAGQVLTHANFGKNFPLARQRFLELAEMAPRSMGKSHLALPLLVAATKAESTSPEYIAALEHAASLERGAYNVGLAKSTASANIDKGMQLGHLLGGATENITKTMLASNLPSGTAVNNAGQAVGQAVGQAAGQAAAPPVQINYGAELQKIENTLENGKQHMTDITHKLMEVYGRAPTAQEIYGVAKDLMPKHASANPEFIGDSLALNYLLANSTASMHKLSVAYSDILKGSLLAAGTAALTAGISLGIEKGYDAWQSHKSQTHLDSSFNSAMKRLEKGVSGDPYFESVRSKIEQDPVHYKQMAREAFNVLSDTSPAMARHPIIAKSFMARVIQSDGEMPREDISTYNRINDLSRNTMPGSQRFFNAFKAMGGEASMGSAGRMIVDRPLEDERHMKDVAMEFDKHQNQLALQAVKHRDQMELHRHKGGTTS
jgi:hypothetical protein